MVYSKFRSASFFIFILVIVSLTLNFSSPVKNSGWELVYENDSYGRTISGDIDELISASLDGCDVKVILHFYSEELHYQMQLSKVRIDICNRIVTGYNFDFRQNPSENNVLSRISTYSTNGEYISTYEENKFYRNPEIIRVSMSWYINE